MEKQEIHGKELKGTTAIDAHRPMQEQEIALRSAFSGWKGHNEQVDDVCVIGVRV
jgi:hypothetical protein